MSIDLFQTNKQEADYMYVPPPRSGLRSSYWS